MSVVAPAQPADAHHRGGAPHPGGIVIPSLSHGQMPTMARNRSAVMDLADAQPFTDPVFRALQSHVALQHALCLWAVVPGSIADEASPFNECAHADLAGAHALLMHMVEMPFAHDRAVALLAKIQREMRDDPAASLVCRFGGQPFHANDFIYPHLGAAFSHPPTALTVLAATLLPVLGVAAARSTRRRKGGSLAG